jgi:hypothetical protein
MGLSAKRLRFKKAVTRLQEVFARPAFRVVVFVLSLTLFYWPFVTQMKPWSGWALFVFYFGAWLGVVLLMFAMGLSLARREEEQSETGANTGER